MAVAMIALVVMRRLPRERDRMERGERCVFQHRIKVTGSNVRRSSRPGRGRDRLTAPAQGGGDGLSGSIATGVT